VKGKAAQTRGATPPEVDRICSDDRRTRFLVKDMLPVQSIAIVAGESTIGKSPLLYQMALCVASGIPLLGMATEKSRVLYFDLENDLYDCQGIRDALVKHLQLCKAPDDFLLVTEPPTDLEGLLKEVQPQLVIIDSLRAFRPDITDKPANTGQWLKDIRRMSRQYRCAFLIVHHLRKPSHHAIRWPAW
jgi:RecA-family ATPase